VSDLLRAEGFTEIRYIPATAAYQHKQVALGEADFSAHFAAPTVMAIDAGSPLTVIAGIHVGCFELFAAEGIRSVVDLKGRTVGALGFGSASQVYVSAIASYVGLDPRKDIRWVTDPAINPMQLFLAHLMRGMAGIRWRVWRKALITFTELGVEAIRFRQPREPHPPCPKISSCRSSSQPPDARKSSPLSTAGASHPTAA
jgi:ABC-type nitrate/sulfonate/bicarbonate transport system substrate-binding protein